MNWTERRERLRAIVGGTRCIFPASVYDGISARIAGDRLRSIQIGQLR